MSAEELKEQGNAAFAAKDYEKAIDFFSKAIAASEKPNHVLYSNRSACYASLHRYEEALNDANKCVEINPTWAKGYVRKGSAEHGYGDLIPAKESLEKALELDPNNAAAHSALKNVQVAIENVEKNPMSFASLFKQGGVFEKLKTHPDTKDFAEDPDFQKNLNRFLHMPNPLAARPLLTSDSRLQKALTVALGQDLSGLSESSSDFKSDDTSNNTSAKETAPSSKPAKEEVVAKEEPKEPEVPESKKEADEEKANGNAAYKKRSFDEAIGHYNKAWELHKDITYLNNRAAAEYEKGDYDTAIQTCLEAVDQGRELRADYKLIAKAYARAGNCYLKKEDLPQAIEYFNRSLTEHRTPDVLSKLRSTEKELKKREEESYIDPEKAEAAREEGNAKFKEGNWPEAIKSYTEAIKRAPKDPRGYANRAAALLKLISYPDVVRDCDMAISLDPKFFKAYTRKATALLIMRDYRQCMDVLEVAREIDTEHKHTREIEEIYQKAATARFAPLPGETQEQTAERLANDPEIDEIRRDPIMNTILQQAQNDPAALQDHMKNPEVRRKIGLLAAAGIIRTR